QSPLYLRALRSSVLISSSTLVVGPPMFRYNRIVAPGNIRFDSSDFILTESIEPTVVQDEGDRELILFAVTWDNVDYAYFEGETDQFVETLTDQTLRFDNCGFHLANDVEVSDTAIVADSVGAQHASNRL